MVILINMSPRLSCLLFTVCALANVTAYAQTTELHSTRAHDAESKSQSTGVRATAESEVTLRGRLIQADASKRGELWLTISAETSTPTPAHLTLRIPLSSTEDIYGESRSCKVIPGAPTEFTYSAGMDENNFLRFAPGVSEQPMQLLLNKYLCRALAAPFHCNGREVTLPSDWSQWRMARNVSLSLSSDAPATLRATSVLVKENGKPFEPTSCPVIAPSNGLCCVANKTTEWHCGGTPVGPGWHQVSGECFHRETGGQCTDKTVFAPLPPMQ
jgi:hypothetical protein